MTELEKNKIHIRVCLGALPNCKNIDSYGVICVECNLCGRFDPPKHDKEETARKRKENPKERRKYEY